jgi:hypothetical protein
LFPTPIFPHRSYREELRYISLFSVANIRRRKEVYFGSQLQRLKVEGPHLVIAF